MNTLVCSQKSPISIAKASPWKPTTPAVIPSTKVPKRENPSTTTWKLQANAKGFGSSRPRPATIQESTINKTSNINNHSNNDEEQIPQEVFERMGLRIVVAVGTPMGLGIALLHLFGLAKEQQLWDVPVWIPFTSTLLTFGASAFGIAYGALSTSLNPNEKGSFLGLEEAQTNWVEMWKEEDEGNQ